MLRREKMRLTLDIDKKSSFDIGLILLKGLFYFRKLPEKARNTERGIHITYRDIATDEANSLKYRRLLGDDKNRVRLDRMATKKPKQILFTEKEVICQGFIHRNWIKKVGAYNKGVCKCHRRVVYSEKLWTDSEKCIKIHHKNSVCTFPLKIRVPRILHMLKLLGAEVV
jgi:hypothetical protein